MAKRHWLGVEGGGEVRFGGADLFVKEEEQGVVTWLETVLVQRHEQGPPGELPGFDQPVKD